MSENRTTLEQAIQFSKDDLDEAIRLDPQYAEAYSHRAATYFQMEQIDQAFKDWAEAIRLQPEFANPYASRALANTHLGNDTEAQRDVERAVGLGLDRGLLDSAIAGIKERR